jgi:hypothetical protein
MLFCSTDSEHLGATGRASSLGCWLTILHLDGLGTLNFSLGSAFDTITLHVESPSFIFSLTTQYQEQNGQVALRLTRFLRIIVSLKRNLKQLMSRFYHC